MSDTLGGLRAPFAPLENHVEPWTDARRAAADGRTDEATQAFGQLLATLLVRELRRSLSDGLVGRGPGSDVYEGWFDEHLGRSLAESDALGLAGVIKTSIQRVAAEEARSGGPST